MRAGLSTGGGRAERLCGAGSCSGVAALCWFMSIMNCSIWLCQEVHPEEALMEAFFLLMQQKHPARMRMARATAMIAKNILEVPPWN